MHNVVHNVESINHCLLALLFPLHGSLVDFTEEAHHSYCDGVIYIMTTTYRIPELDAQLENDDGMLHF